MVNKLSTWGIVGVVVYGLLVASLFFYATSCTEAFCGLMALLAGMPWLLLLDLVGGDSYASGAFGWISIILNALILYFLFAALQKWAKRRKI